METTTDTLTAATEELDRHAVRSLRMGGGCFVEADGDLNDASRAVVGAMRKTHGQAWLGIVNRYRDDGDKPWIWQYDPAEGLYNFGASFVLPAYDAELERLLRERHEAEYTDVGADGRRIQAIHLRIEAVGGVSLCWS